MPGHLLNKRQWIKLGMFAIACILGVAAVSFNRIDLALFASLAMGFSFWNVKENPREVEGETIIPVNHEISSGRLISAITLFIFSVLFGMGAVYFSETPQDGTTSLILWLISIALVLLAGVVFDKADPFIWLKRIKNMSSEARRYLYIEMVVVFVITEIALFLRATNLEYFPPAMHGDEGEMGMEALRFLGIGDPIAPFGIGWGNFPNLFYYLQAGAIGIFGRNQVGIRMVAALFGTFCVPLMYLIGRKFWGKLAGFTAAWLIAVSHFYIHYSRLGLNNIESVFFMILFVLLFLAPQSNALSDHDQEPKKADASSLLKNNCNITPHIAVGLTCGLAQYMYLGSRLILLIALPLYILLLIRKRINIVQVAVAGLTAILVFAPLGRFYLQNPNYLTNRLETVSIFNPANIELNYGEGVTLSNDLFFIVSNQLERNLSFYLKSGDASSFYPLIIPGFDFITALLFWLGLGVVFSRSQRLPETALILWFVFGIIFGGMLTNYAPNGPRLLISTPSIFIMSGVFVQRTWNVLKDFLHKNMKIQSSFVWLSAPILACVLAVTLGINMYYYFGVSAKYGMNIISMNIAKEIALDSPVDHVYLLGYGKVYTTHGAIRFLAGEGKAMDLMSSDDLPPLVKDGKGITVLAVFPYFDELKSVQSRYPQGVMSQDIFLGRLIIMKYRIPPLSIQ